LGLGVRWWNVTANRSPTADLSPELESRPIYSTSFFARGFSDVASLSCRKVRIPFAWCSPRSRRRTARANLELASGDAVTATVLPWGAGRPHCWGRATHAPNVHASDHSIQMSRGRVRAPNALVAPLSRSR
jgi:hypothetical protein